MAKVELLTEDELRSVGTSVMFDCRADNFGATSYDIRLGRNYYRSREDTGKQLTPAQPELIVDPGEYVLVTSYERFSIPADLLVQLGPKTVITRRGLIPLFGKVIDPGFSGTLVLGFYNSAPVRIRLICGEDVICKAEFWRLETPVKKEGLVKARPEQAEGRIPREDMDYFLNHPRHNPLTLDRRLTAVEWSVASIRWWGRAIVVGFILATAAAALGGYFGGYFVERMRAGGQAADSVKRPSIQRK